MAVEVTWLGHNCWTIDADGQKFVIDPFLNDSPTAPVKAEQVEAHYMLVSHGHADHISDAVAIANRTGAIVITNFEVGNWLAKQGVASERIIGMNLGGTSRQPFGSVKLTIAHHSSSLPDGTYGGNPGGFLLETRGKRLYFACDTALFLDMKLIGAGGLDLAVLPIGDLYTMGPEESLEAVKLLNPRLVAPCHYNTWPPIAQDAGDWAQRVRSHTAAEPIVVESGGSFRV